MLYKYRGPIDFNNIGTSNTAKIFSEAGLFYAKPSTFNDPFDGMLNFDYSASKEEAIDYVFRSFGYQHRSRGRDIPVDLRYEEAKRTVDEMYDRTITGTYWDNARYYRDLMDYYGVLALSAEKHNLLLWAHYAANHKGLCLEFDWGQTGLPAVTEMVYATNYRKVRFWAHTEDELAIIALYQKSVDWSYEREYRSTNPTVFEWRTTNPDPAIIKTIATIATKSIGLPKNLIKRLELQHYKSHKHPVELGSSKILNFEKDSLRSVLFGMRMEPEVRERHKEFILANGFNPEFKVAYQHPDRYAVEFRDG
ncbi:DUF2971 domain-containing protein [Burkholderia sp. S171]|uniref:DUF2971 domain-containing protein n=1 Tax=Burkholderia sp. S171 TaxID=1641860 RepID=UPI00131B74F5|nr:DUF2971 domain-containing protein [Burkholderia sp. S171]